MGDVAELGREMRQTIGIVDRIESNGFGVIHELEPRRQGEPGRTGFFNNDTLIAGSMAAVRPGSKVTILVEDKDDLFVVRSIERL